MKKHKKHTFVKVPIEECSREEDAEGISEVDVQIALSRLPDEFSDEELEIELKQVVTNRVLGSLVEKGLVKAVWDEKQNDFVFFPADNKA